MYSLSSVQWCPLLQKLRTGSLYQHLPRRPGSPCPEPDAGAGAPGARPCYKGPRVCPQSGSVAGDTITAAPGPLSSFSLLTVLRSAVIRLLCSGCAVCVQCAVCTGAGAHENGERARHHRMSPYSMSHGMPQPPCSNHVGAW